MSTKSIMHTVSDMQTMASAVAESGLFGMKTPEQALALMLVAQAEGQHPATITQDYDIIQGRACRKTHSVMARFQAMGGRAEWHKLTDKEAEATFSHPHGGSVRISWTIEMARGIGLANKDNWKHYPRAMLRARCIAEGVRTVYPAAIGGMLLSEEAQDAPAEKVVSVEPARPALEHYPDDRFSLHLPKWKETILGGKKTAEDVIAMLRSRATLTAEQEQAIRDIEAAETEEEAS